jgi:hypothetical protein
MAYFEMRAGGGGPNEPWCTSCKAPITETQRSMRVDFINDPQGHKGLSGVYHEACGQPFASLARAMKMLSFRGF